MHATPEELDWWRAERRHHRWKHALRVSVPWAIATCAGILLHDHGWRHLEPWIHGVFAGTVGGTLMGIFTWGSNEKTANLRELRARRLRSALLQAADGPPSAGEREPTRLIPRAE